jgi:hypothetical protein
MEGPLIAITTEVAGMYGDMDAHPMHSVNQLELLIFLTD